MQSDSDKANAARDQQADTHEASSEQLLQRITHQVTSKLQEGRSKDAVRLFVEAYNRGLLPKGHQLPNWVLQTFGKDTAAKLFLAFAHFPCMYCKGGLESCEVCGGRGVREGPFCDTCIALGRARCEFCDGTGLATYSFFPPELWLPVIVDRARLGIRQVKHLIAHPIPGFSAPDAENQLIELILNLNKLLGLLENAILAAKQIAHHDAHTPTILQTIDACNQAAQAATKYLRQVIRTLAATIRHTAKSLPTDSAEAQFHNARAAFYEELALSERFQGTALHHPFLDPKSHS